MPSSEETRAIEELGKAVSMVGRRAQSFRSASSDVSKFLTDCASHLGAAFESLKKAHAVAMAPVPPPAEGEPEPETPKKPPIDKFPNRKPVEQRGGPKRRR